MQKQPKIGHWCILLILGLVLTSCRPASSPPQSQVATQPATAPVVTALPETGPSGGKPAAPEAGAGLSITPQNTATLDTIRPDPRVSSVTPAGPGSDLPGSGPAYPPEVEERIWRVIGELIPVYQLAGEPSAAGSPQVAPPAAPMDLINRMAYYQTPGISIAVVNQGKLEWVRGFGVTNTQTGDPVTAETLFQAASISKPVSAMGALALVQEGKLALDEPINQKLTSWQVPGGQPVTLRQVLSHTAGFGVHGFAGYSIDAPLPTTLEILNGEPPANSPPITLVNPPGSRYEYSGGGYVVLQQLMLDVTGQSYPELMKQRVLDPLGMGASSFQQPILFEWSSQAASGHVYDGQPLPGGWKIYPQMAPSGLWSTPGDLAQVLIEIDRAAHQGNGAVLSQAMAQAMLAPVQQGNAFGLVVSGNDRAAMFGHGGSNQGYRGLMFGVQGTGQGAVVLANSDNAMYLIFEVFRAIAHEYGWPEVPQWRAVQREVLTPAPEDPASYAGLAGVYQLGRLTFTIIADRGRLWVQVPTGGPRYPLYPTGENVFTTLDQAQFTFSRDANGNATSLTTNAWGERDMIAQKVSP